VDKLKLDWNNLFAPSAISLAHSGLTAVYASSVLCLTPKTCCLVLSVYTTALPQKTLLTPLVETSASATRPPVMLSAAETVKT
jgi:hypothetical protein